MPCRLFILPLIFGLCTGALWLLIRLAPVWTEGSLRLDTLPSQFDNFTQIVSHFRAYNNEHYHYISLLFTAVYIYKQTFAIPGSFLLNIVAGAVFGPGAGFLLVCLLTTVGASLCYLFSEMFGREYVLYYFGQRLTYLQQKLDDHSNRLLPFLLFARMFPISPSWLLNIVAPFLNIPLPIFALSVLIGLAPYNFICVQAGYLISELRSWEDIFNSWTMIKLFLFALIPLAFALFSPANRLNKDSLSSSSSSESHNRKVEIV